MRSEQNRRGGERGNKAEGQYEKDSWRGRRQRNAPPRERELAERRPASARPGRAEHRSEEEPYEASGPYEPFEPGHPREERGRFGAGPPPRYFGTGFMGRGGPGFTGGYYGFGQGSLEPDWRAERRDPVGGEGAGSESRRIERRYPPGPKGYQRSDERLREDISDRLMQAHDIDSSDVTVAVSGAKVVLEGTVPERRMKHAIEDLADACPGVQDIDNRIRVKR